MGTQDSHTGEKTEKATTKKLRDARKDGNITKSKDLSQTVTMLAWGLLSALLSGYFGNHLGALFELSWINSQQDFFQVLVDAGLAAVKTLCLLTLVPMAMIGFTGVLIEFIQAGPVFSAKPVTPQFDRLNVTNGFKRIFSLDNVVEVIKSIFKTLIILCVVIAVIVLNLDDVIQLPLRTIPEFPATEHHLLLLTVGWVVGLFLFLSTLDWLYQKYSYLKKLRMSKYDVKKERKDQEGDPQIKNTRMRLYRQWVNQNAQKAVTGASALIVNPTHISVALYYSPEETLVPVVAAKGEGNLAKLMRQTAVEENVPIIKNVPLARALNFRADEDDFIPEDLFQAVAEVLAWAHSVKQQMRQGQAVNLFREIQA